MSGIGSYRDFVQLLKRTDDRDPEGQPLTGDAVWTVFDEGWADIRYLNGLEVIKADAIASLRKASIRLRGYRTDLVSGMRVREGDTVFVIKAALPDKQSREHVDLACEEVR